MREQRLYMMDFENVIDEIESLGRGQKHAANNDALSH
jgi:hypothetical protein